MTLSIVTVSHRSGSHLPSYVESFLASGSGRQGADIEFIVVENSGDVSTDGLLNPLRRAGFPVIFIQAENRGFGAGCNVGATQARGDTLVFANPDLAFVDALDPIDAAAGSDDWGTVVQEDGQGECYTFDVLPEYKSVWGELRQRYRSFSPADPVWCHRLYPVGSFFIVSRAMFEQVGGFDERFFMYHEEAELARRLHPLAGPPTLFEGIRVRHDAFGSEPDFSATWQREARGLLTYAEITGERGVLLTRALTQLLLIPVSPGARRRLRLLLKEVLLTRARRRS